MHTTTDSVTLNRSELRALLAHADRDEDRPHMAGLGVDLSEGRVYATDGKRAVVAQSRSVPSAARTAPAFVVPRKLLEEGLRLCGKGRLLTVRRWGLTATSTAEGLALGPGGDHVSVEVTDELGTNVATLHSALPDCVPPPVCEVVPAADQRAGRLAWATLASAFLRDVATIAEAAGSNAIRMWAATGDGDPIRIDATGPTALWTAVLMPLAPVDDAPKAPFLTPRNAPTPSAVETPSAELPPAGKPPAPHRRRRRPAAP